MIFGKAFKRQLKTLGSNPMTKKQMKNTKRHKKQTESNPI